MFTAANTLLKSGSETVYLAAVAQTKDTNYTIVYATGAVTFISATVITGESLGTGDGAATVFGPTANAPIVADSQTVYLDAAPQTEVTDYTIVDSTDTVTFTAAPGGGVAVTIDYTSVPPASGVAVTIDYKRAIVDEVVFVVSTALDSGAIDLTTTVDINSDGLLSDEASKSHVTVVSYISKDQRVDDITWTRTQVGKGDGDALLEPGEKMRITVKFTSLSPVLNEEDRFTIEIKPDLGSSLVLERTIPPVIDDIMDLR